MPTFSVASRLPIFISHHHKDLGYTRIGLLLATTSVGCLVATPLVAKYAGRVGRKNVLLIGVILLTISNLFQAWSAYVSSDGAFQALTVIARLMQGCSNSMITAAVMTLINSNFPDDAMYYMGFFEMCIGIGFMMGPLFTLPMNFQVCFFFMAGFSLVLGLIAVLTLPTF